MDKEKIERAARYLRAEHRNGTKFQLLPPDLAPVDESEAYRMQAAHVGLLEADGLGPVIGYKIALTSKAMQEMVGSDRPATGVLLEARRHRSPKDIELGDYQRLGIECELAVELADDLPKSAAPLSIDDVAEKVRALRPAFELVEDRNADYDHLEIGTLIADNAWNGGIVLGPEITGWRDTDFAAWPARLEVNGAEVAAGQLSDAMGHPFNVVSWLAQHLAAQGTTLKAGMTLMTGSVVQTQFARPNESFLFSVNDTWQAEINILN